MVTIPTYPKEARHNRCVTCIYARNRRRCVLSASVSLSLSLSLSFLPLSFSLPFFLRNRNPRRKRRYEARLFALLVAENTPPPISLPIYMYILIYINNQFRSTINDFRTKTAIQTLDIRNLSIPLVYKHRIRPCLG